jgi:T5SS/PEP-CTERM-associated repeat protein
MKRLILISTLFLIPFLLHAQGGFRVFVLPDTNQSFLSDMSANGKYIVGHFGERLRDGYVRPFLWHADTDSFTYFDDNSVHLIAVSNNGMVAGGAGGPSAFRWTPESGFLDLGDLGLGAVDISNDGSVIVGVGINEEGWGYLFRWSESGGIEDMGFMTEIRHGHQTQAVSGNGVVVIGWAMVEVDSELGGTYTTTEGFKWDGAYTRLGFLASNLGHLFSKAWGVSFDGSTIVGESIGDCIDDGSVCRSKAVVWKNGGPPMPLPMLDGYETSTALAVTGDGSLVIGTMGFHTTGSEAVIWESDGTVRFIRDIIENDYGIDLSEWYPTTFIATHISDDGKVIMGRGLKLSGEWQGWIMNLEPPVAWTNPNGGVFGVGSNWLTGVPPREDQTAIFDQSFYLNSADNLNMTIKNSLQDPVKVSIFFDELVKTRGLDIGDAHVLFDLQSHSYGIDELKMWGGSVNSSELEIINGVLGTTNKVSIGEQNLFGQMIVGGGGTLEITPLDEMGNSLVVGSDGCGGQECGKILVYGGGNLVTNSSKLAGSVVGLNTAQGSVLITGENSVWADSSLVVLGEKAGSGLLEISQGGEFSGSSLWLAFWDDSHGELIVSDEASVHLRNQLLVGFGKNTTADVTFSGGAFGRFDKGIRTGLGENSKAEIQVTGENTSVLVSDTTFIAVGGSGGLSVSDGAELYNYVAVLPGDYGGIGSAAIDGSESKWIVTNTLWIGHRGIGFVRVTDGATLQAATVELGPFGSLEASDGNLYIGEQRVQTLDMNSLVTGSLVSVTEIGGSVYTDTLKLSDGAEIIADSVIFGDGGYLAAYGIFPFDVTNRGGINPGDTLHTPGTLTVNADYTQMPNGTLFIELGGDLPGTGHDRLIVTGTAHLAGTLDITVLKDFEPQVGQSFVILTAENITGTFDEIITNRDLGVDVIYNPASVLITVTSPVSVDEHIYLLPTEYSLHQNYPNPFNPSTTIRYDIPVESHVLLEVYNLLGQRVAVLVDELREAGYHTVQFDAGNLSSGMYLYRIRAGEYMEVRKFMLLR